MNDERLAQIRRDAENPSRFVNPRPVVLRELLEEIDRLREDFVCGMRVANKVTLDTQSTEEACAELVRLVLAARAQRDELWLQLVNREPNSALKQALELAEQSLAYWAATPDGKMYRSLNFGEQDPNGTNEALAAVRAALKGPER